MKSAGKRSILKKQRWGDSMKLCDVLILIGILITLLSVEILFAVPCLLNGAYSIA
jgi:hypothetical protein